MRKLLKQISCFRLGQENRVVALAHAILIKRAVAPAHAILKAREM